MKMLSKITMVLPFFALCSCASIVSKSDYPVTITSPKATKVTVTNKKTNAVVYSGNTPTTLTLPAKGGYFSPAKYEVKTANSSQELKAKLDPWYYGNIVFGGPVGVFVDPATGAMWKLPKEVQTN